MPEPLRVETPSDGVRLLTLSVPERRNAMTADLTAAWSAAVAQLAADESVRAVVVTGEGTAFCSGGDLSWIGGDAPEEITPDRLRNKMLPFYRTWLSIRELPIPVIAAVNGPAVGAGLCLALACDLRYAAPAARFSAPFTQLGMHPGMAASWLLPEVIGAARSRELLYAGRVVRAEEALAWGLVTDIADDVQAHALEVAAHISGSGPVAVRLTKSALSHPYRPYAEALEWEALAQPVTMATEDFQEGLRAAGERRAPVFRNR